MPARIQVIPEQVFPAVCKLCKRERTCCAVVLVKRYFSLPSVWCTHCRIQNEGRWTVDVAPEKPDVGSEPRVRVLGKGLRARSPSKHGLPFTF